MPIKKEKLSVKRLGVMIAIIIAGAAIGGALFIAITSRSMNAELRDTNEGLRAAVENTDWTNAATLSSDLDALDALRMHVEKLEEWKVHGPPTAMTWGMYVGDELLEPAANAYLAAIHAGLVESATTQLVAKLTGRRGKPYIQTFEALKTYLLLGDATHLAENRDFFVTSLIANALEQKGVDGPEVPVLRHKMAAHLLFYADQMAMQSVEKHMLDDGLIASTRDDLSRVAASSRYYDLFVTALEDEKIDPAGADTKENRAFPAVTLASVFEGRPKVLAVLKHTKDFSEVRGPYTDAGRKRVEKGIDEGRKRLVEQRWVVPLSPEDAKNGGGKIMAALNRVMQDYDAQYTKEWRDFFKNIEIEAPKSDEERSALLTLWVSPEEPLRTLLKTLTQHAREPSGQLAAVRAFADAPLTKYLDALRSAVAAHKSGGALDLTAVEKVAHEQLLTLSDAGKAMLTPLLLGPLKKPS